ncbi:hypothetical protein NDU88_001230 [Pleurodeles waltl]|uniref:Uncharacterized protein n=1 Tax=Pleurodeles waltl TaxID=8319 RepID=A0AAV7L8W8_PLEWA|nr:hypothetical protein NDU88_001230 [Pleurodeles waltl]
MLTSAPVRLARHHGAGGSGPRASSGSPRQLTPSSVPSLPTSSRPLPGTTTSQPLLFQRTLSPCGTAAASGPSTKSLLLPIGLRSAPPAMWPVLSPSQHPVLQATSSSALSPCSSAAASGSSPKSFSLPIGLRSAPPAAWPALSQSQHPVLQATSSSALSPCSTASASGPSPKSLLLPIGLQSAPPAAWPTLSLSQHPFLQATSSSAPSPCNTVAASGPSPKSLPLPIGLRSALSGAGRVARAVTAPRSSDQPLVAFSHQAAFRTRLAVPLRLPVQGSRRSPTSLRAFPHCSAVPIPLRDPSRAIKERISSRPWRSSAFTRLPLLPLRPHTPTP